MHRLTHWIEGAARAPGRDHRLPAHEPATGRIHAEVAAGDATDMEAAISAAGRAAPAWAALPDSARSAWLGTRAAVLDARIDAVAHAEAGDGGMDAMRFFTEPGNVGQTLG